MKSVEMNYDIEEQLLDIPSVEVNTSSTPMTFTFINKCNFYKLFWIFLFGSIFGLFLIILISFDLLVSALAVNRWSERERGVPSDGYVDVFLDSHYGNDKMDYIFPHLKFIETNKIT